MKLKERAAAKAARRAARKSEVRITKGPPIEAADTMPPTADVTQDGDDTIGDAPMSATGAEPE